MKNFIKIPVFIIILFGLGIVSGHFTFKLMSLNKTLTVPDLTGKSMIDATNDLRSKGLYIRLEGEGYDSNVPQGYVIRQDIPAGNKIKEGREIGVVLSRGPRIKFVPDIVGQPLDAAEGLLKEKGIRIGRIIYVHSEKAQKNLIIAQRPEANEKSAENFQVVVSLGAYSEEEL